MKTNNMSREYKIDYINGEITVSKRFLKAAGIYNSAEYKLLKELRTDYPTFDIKIKEIAKKKGKNSGKNLTIPKMREHIIFREGENSLLLQQFDHLYKLYETHSGRYAKLKSWYLKQFADEYTEQEEETPSDDSNESNIITMNR